MKKSRYTPDQVAFGPHQAESGTPCKSSAHLGQRGVRGNEQLGGGCPGLRIKFKFRY
jgi:hypothetical protein